MRHLISAIYNLFSKQEKQSLYGLFILILIGSILEVTGIGMFMPLMLSIADSNLIESNVLFQRFVNTLSINSPNGLILTAIILLISVQLIKFAFLSFLALKTMKFSFSLQARISEDLFEKYLSSNYDFHLQINSSTLIRNIINESSLFTTSAVIPALFLITEVFILFAISIFLFVLEPIGFLLIFLIILSAAGTFYLLFKNKILYWGQQRQKNDGLKLKVVQEGFKGIKEIILFNLSSFYKSQYQSHNRLSAESNSKQATLNQIPRLWIELVSMFALGSLVFLLVHQNTEFSILLAKLGIFAAAAIRIMPSATRILSSIQALRFSRPVVEIIQSSLKDGTKSTKDNSSNINNILSPSFSFNNYISFNNVSFKYPNTNDYVLRNLSLKLKKGKIYGISGPSGAGKSTFIDLLMGIVDPTEGILSVDDNPLSEVKDAWHSNISYVPQNIFLFDDTIKNNVLLGTNNDCIGDAEIYQVLESVRLKDFINQQPNGLYTNIGEHGDKISGGQRQRLGIARALLRNADLLILDESTSAVDKKTELDIFENLINLKNQKTIFFITHREELLKFADEILDINDLQIFASKNQ